MLVMLLLVLFGSICLIVLNPAALSPSDVLKAETCLKDRNGFVHVQWEQLHQSAVFKMSRPEELVSCRTDV